MSNGWAAARKLRRSVDNLRRVLAVELVCAAAGSTCAPRCSPRRPPAPRSRAVRGTRRRPRARPVAVAGSRTPPSSCSPTAACSPRSNPPSATGASAMPEHRDPCARREAPTCIVLGLAAGSGLPDAAQQPRPRGRRAAGRPRRLRRHRAGGASWDAFDAMVRTLRTLGDDETMLVQSGKPVGVFRTHEWAPRVLLANSNLVPEWAHLGRVPPPRGDGPHDVRADDGRVVDLHRHAGDPAGHVRVLRRDRPRAASAASLARHDHAHRRARRHGRRAAAGGDDERRRRAVHRSRPAPRPSAASRPATSTRSPTRSTTRSPAARAAQDARRALSVGLVGNAADAPAAAARAAASTADIVTDQTSAHDPLTLRPRDLTPEAPAELRPHRPRRAHPPRARRRWRRTARRWSASSTRAPRCSTTATACAPRHSSAASTAPSTTRASCPPTSGRCSARARARSAGSRSPAIRPTSPPPTAPCSRSSPTTSASPLDPPGRRAGRLPGAAGAHLLARATASAHRLGLRFNEMVRRGELKAPIVIGRDHLDSGSVASPYRETEAMADGSDAIADWPLLNALVNTASRGDVGEHPPRRRCRHRPLDPRRHGVPRRRHRPGGAEAASACSTNRPGHGRDPPRRRRLRARDRGRRRARRARYP